MKTYTLPVIGLMTLGASAFAAAAPSTGNSLPARDNFSACKWLGDRFKWFNSERDHKNPYVQEFNVSLRMQYGLDSRRSKCTGRPFWIFRAIKS